MTVPLTSPLLDGCVLSVVAHGDTYGYSLTQQMKQILDISESSLYPVLRRLQRDGCLTVYDQPVEGRNRRYYALTDDGRAWLSDCRNEWLSHRGKIDRLLLGEQPTISAQA